MSCGVLLSGVEVGFDLREQRESVLVMIWFEVLFEDVHLLKDQVDELIGSRTLEIGHGGQLQEELKEVGAMTFEDRVRA